MAPEVMKNECYTAKADIYSFALCLFEMVFGPNPFRKLQVVQLAQKVVNEKHRPLFPDAVVLPHLKALVERCWDQDPAKRPSAEDALELLENPCPQCVIYVKQIRRERRFSKGLLLIIVLLVFFFYLYYFL